MLPLRCILEGPVSILLCLPVYRWRDNFSISSSPPTTLSLSTSLSASQSLQAVGLQAMSSDTAMCMCVGQRGGGIHLCLSNNILGEGEQEWRERLMERLGSLETDPHTGAEG